MLKKDRNYSGKWKQKKSQSCTSLFLLQSWADCPWNGRAAWKMQHSPRAPHIPQCHTAMKGLKATLPSLADIHPIFKTSNRAQVGLRPPVLPCSWGTMHTGGTDTLTTALPVWQGSKAQAKRSAVSIPVCCHSVRLWLIVTTASKHAHNLMIMQFLGNKKICSSRSLLDHAHDLWAAFQLVLGHYMKKIRSWATVSV